MSYFIFCLILFFTSVAAASVLFITDVIPNYRRKLINLTKKEIREEFEDLYYSRFKLYSDSELTKLIPKGAWDPLSAAARKLLTERQDFRTLHSQSFPEENKK